EGAALLLELGGDLGDRPLRDGHRVDRRLRLGGQPCPHFSLRRAQLGIEPAASAQPRDVRVGGAVRAPAHAGQHREFERRRIVWRRWQAPSSAPAIAALVSVSPPRPTVWTSACSNSSVCRHQKAFCSATSTQPWWVKKSVGAMPFAARFTASCAGPLACAAAASNISSLLAPSTPAAIAAQYAAQASRQAGLECVSMEASRAV